MGFSLPERYFVIVNLLLGAIVLYFLALSVNDGVKIHLAGEPLAEQSSAAGAAQTMTASGLRPRTYYDAITQRDIFNLRPVAVEAAPVEVEDLQIKLIGTSHLSEGSPYAIIADSSGNQALYRLGETIPDAGRLVDISPNRAIVLHDGHRVALEIPQGGNASDAQAPALRRGPRGRAERASRHGFPRHPGHERHEHRGGIKKLSPNRYVINRGTLNDNLSNMSRLFTEIRAVPNFQNGATSGYTLSEIEAGSIFQEIGLQDGDVLTAVDGQAVNDPLKAMTLLQTVRDRPSITVNLTRNGSPMQLHYNIH